MMRRVQTVEIYHPTVAKGSGGGRTVTYGGSADVTTHGQLVPVDVRYAANIFGDRLNADVWLILPKNTDVRPRERSAQDEKTRDRVVIGSKNYLCLWAEAMQGLGEHVRAWLVRERT
jgi:hypothetical protein